MFKKLDQQIDTWLILLWPLFLTAYAMHSFFFGNDWWSSALSFKKKKKKKQAGSYMGMLYKVNTSSYSRKRLQGSQHKASFLENISALIS